MHFSRKSRYAVVIGGANIDITGASSAALVAGDSNPGIVRFSAGGVARNVAENLARLDVPVYFLTVFGGDMYAEHMKQECMQTGIDISAAQTLPERTSSVYLCINDAAGEMQLAVSDMNLYDSLTPEYIAVNMLLINGAAVCITDTNIPKASLEFLARHCTVPLFIDPVSTAKAEKIRDILPFIHTIKPNKMEMQCLTGIRLTDDRSLRNAAAVLLQAGVKRLIVSLGKDGLFCSDAGQCLLLPAMEVSPVSTTGAGDSLFAGIAWAFIHGFDLETSARVGQAAASICIESPHTVSRSVTKELLCKRAGIRGEEYGI